MAGGVGVGNNGRERQSSPRGWIRWPPGEHLLMGLCARLLLNSVQAMWPGLGFSKSPFLLYKMKIFYML